MVGSSTAIHVNWEVNCPNKTNVGCFPLRNIVLLFTLAIMVAISNDGVCLFAL